MTAITHPTALAAALAAQSRHAFAGVDRCACGVAPTDGYYWTAHRLGAALDGVTEWLRGHASPTLNGDPLIRAVDWAADLISHGGRAGEHPDPDPAMLAYRRRVAALTPLPKPGRARCPRCAMPWQGGNTDMVTVKYTDRLGVCLLCAWCWPQTTPSERLLYAAGLVFGVWARDAHTQVGAHQEWPAIAAAVLAAP